MRVFDRLGDQLEGKGRSILYGIIAVILVGTLIGFFRQVAQSQSRRGSRCTLGRAAITQVEISTSPVPGTAEEHFDSEQQRAQKAIEEFQKVAAKHGEPYRTEARYFIATNLLYVDRNKGISDLSDLTKDSNKEVAVLSKFALAQAKEADGKLDEAAGLYRELVAANSDVVSAETANLRLALLYSKQGKKKEATDLLFQIVDAARKAKDDKGDPKPQSRAASDADEELKKLDQARYDQLPPAPPPIRPF